MIYTVCYKEYLSDDIHTKEVEAKSAPSAWDKVAFEPNSDGEIPYSAWVESVKYKNGRIKFFNNFEGKPY